VQGEQQQKETPPAGGMGRIPRIDKKQDPLNLFIENAVI
jgi:hypothetical protein